MRYHAPTKCFVIERQSMELLAMQLRYAMQGVRELGGFPLEPHKRDSCMTRACHVEKALIDLADRLGIDLGGTRPGQIDLRDKP
jgi:hypothetical protein